MYKIVANELSLIYIYIYIYKINLQLENDVNVFAICHRGRYTYTEYLNTNRVFLLCGKDQHNKFPLHVFPFISHKQFDIILSTSIYFFKKYIFSSGGKI